MKGTPMRDTRSPGVFFRDEVLSRLRVEEIYTGVKWTSTRGRYWRAPCPIHGGDRKDAFSVDTLTKGWTCWTRCGSGDAVAYLNGGTRLSRRAWVEGAKKLAALAGVEDRFPGRDLTEEEVRELDERNRREALLEDFLAYAQAALRGDGGEAARAYLEGRGLGIAADSLGLFTTRDAVRSHLLGRKFTREEVESSGVVHDLSWEGRLVIPWRDRWGDLGTFAARDLTGTAEEGDKYRYMTTEKGWAKRKADLVAFGLDEAFRKGTPDPLVLVEGLLDVVRLQGELVPLASTSG